MKKKILAAAIAAIALSGCNETKPSSTNNSTQKTQSPAVARIEPFAVTAEIVPPQNEAKKADAGAMQFEAEVIEAVQMDDGLPLDHSHRSKVDHLARAKEMKELGDFDGAMTEARRAIFDDPSNDGALRFITKLGTLTRQPELVAAAWGRIGKLDVDDPIALVQQSRALLKTGDYEGAVKIAKEAAAQDSASAEPYQAMGRAYLAAGNLQEAIDSFHKAIEINPDHGYAMNNLGFAYLRANENKQAALVLEKAAELLPNVSYVQNNLGVALERVGRMEEAKAAYQKAMDLSPKYVKARINSDRIARVAKVSDDVPVDATPIPMDQTTDVPETFEEQ